MDVDQDTIEQGTPPDTPFDEGFTPSTTRGQPSAATTRGVHAENLYTPLFTESQETDHTNDNTAQQPQAPPNTLDADMAAAAAVEAEAAKLEAAANAARQSTDDQEAEAAAAAAATFIARLAAETEAAAISEAEKGTSRSRGRNQGCG